MSGLTKEQLKNELITHGVELPISSAKKSEYVELYEKHILPVHQSKGDFSSDDDEESSTPSLTPQASMNSNTVIDGVDVSTLNDEELFTRLQALGATCGPIVESTRKIYQKKLLLLMGGDSVDAPQYNGDVDLDDEEEYSDNEEPVEPIKTRSTGVDVTGSSSSSSNKTTTSTTTTYTSQYARAGLSHTSAGLSQTSAGSTYTSAGSPEVRRRIAETTVAASPELTQLTFDPERHTPSPRRSLRSVTSSSSETITVRKVVNNGSSAKFVSSGQITADVKEEVTEESSSKLALLCRLLVKLVLLALLIIALLYIYQLYQENSPENPMKALEELAKQALEAATGQGVEDGDGPVPPAAAPPAAAPPAVAPPAAAPPAVAPPAAPPAPAVPTQ